MADYYATARSSYFAVKDPEAFKQWCTRWDVSPIERQVELPDEDDGSTILPDSQGHMILHGFTCASTGDGALPSYLETDGNDQEEDDLEFEDFCRELSTHLVTGWVAIMMEAGAQKMQFVSGHAVAVNHMGIIESVNLNAIYEIADGMGKHCTEASY